MMVNVEVEVNQVFLDLQAQRVPWDPLEMPENLENPGVRAVADYLDPQDQKEVGVRLVILDLEVQRVSRVHLVDLDTQSREQRVHQVLMDQREILENLEFLEEWDLWVNRVSQENLVYRVFQELWAQRVTVVTKDQAVVKGFKAPVVNKAIQGLLVQWVTPEKLVILVFAWVPPKRAIGVRKVNEVQLDLRALKGLQENPVNAVHPDPKDFPGLREKQDPKVQLVQLVLMDQLVNKEIKDSQDLRA